MMLVACAIRDKQVEAFLPTFFVRAKGEAMRHFIDLFGDNDRFGKHPGDYDLYELYVYDDLNGKVLQHEDRPMKILSGLDAVATKLADV